MLFNLVFFVASSKVEEWNDREQVSDGFLIHLFGKNTQEHQSFTLNGEEEEVVI